MKPFTLTLGLLLAATSFAQDKLNFVSTKKVGDVTKHAWQMNINAVGQEVVVKANLEATVKKVEEKSVELVRVWKDFTIDMGGQSPNVPVEDMTVTAKPDNEPITVVGGVQGTDNFRSYLILNFVLPPAPIGVGEKYTKEVAGKGDAPSYKVETVYETDEDVDGVKLHKFVAKLAENGADGISATTNFWVSDAGEVIKADATFKNLPIPAVGQSVEGKMTLKIIK